MSQFLDPVRLASAVNISVAGGLLVGGDTIDGVYVTVGMRILLKAQSNRTENGIYTVGSDGALTRAIDFDSNAIIPCGSALFVQEGSLFANTGWVVNRYDESAETTLKPGVNPIVFQIFSSNQNLPIDTVTPIQYRSVKGYPLTTTELDNNFRWIETNLATKLPTSEFSSANVIGKLKETTAENAEIDVWTLRGLSPTIDIKDYDSIVIRDSLGDVFANTFNGDLNGNANTADLADYATLANNVDGVVAVVNGGTGANSPTSARNNLGAVNIAGDTMTGKLVLFPGTRFKTSLNIPAADAEPDTPIQGDVWSTNAALKYHTSGVTKTIAALESPAFTGYPTTPTADKLAANNGIASTQFVQLHVTDLNASIALKANIDSATLTGEPRSTTPPTVDASTRIATTKHVDDKVALRLLDYYDKTQVNGLLSTEANNRYNEDEAIKLNIKGIEQMRGIAVGIIMYYASENAPLGWLVCSGAPVSKTTFPQLFAKIGYRFGGGGDTFYLPDLRGEFVRGWDAGRGVDPGRVFGSAQTTGAGGSVYRNTALLPCIKAYSDIDDTSVLTAQNVVNDVIGKVNRSGDTMTGHLTLPGVPSSANHAATKAYVDTIAPWVDANYASNATAAAKISRYGDTMTGYLTLSGAPSSANHAATKAYVDTAANNILASVPKQMSCTSGQYSVQLPVGVQYVASYTPSTYWYVNDNGNQRTSPSGGSPAVYVYAYRSTTAYFDLFPPAGKTMANYVGGVCAGGTNYTSVSAVAMAIMADRIRVTVVGASATAILVNYLLIWR